MSKYLTPELKSQLLQLCSINIIHDNQIAFSADGNTVYIGDPFFDKFSGRVIVCTKKDGAYSWTMINTITSHASNESVWFGACLALSPDGSFLMVGAPHHGAMIGAVHLFTISKTGDVAEIPFPQPQSSERGDGFGSSIVFLNKGDVVVIATPGISGNNKRYGVMYTYCHRVGGWELHSTYSPPDGVGGDEFSRTLITRSDGLLVATSRTRSYTLAPNSNYMEWDIKEFEDIKPKLIIAEEEEVPKPIKDKVVGSFAYTDILTEADLLKAAIKKLKKRLKQITQPT